ncbi:hypothetical protein RF11_13163 [Thelohanellus kitauei]|uniref:Uncharacterized protein n=1 Tax=Thelohanellus kitauei TaxID=669202 RepID=A0A0C2MUK1_THEKT|nr:hypothetical protein RF11_13163 [Thelohanellus kitauei]
MHSFCSYKIISINLNRILFTTEGESVINIGYLIELKALHDKTREYNNQELSTEDTKTTKIKNKLISNIIGYYNSVAADEATGLEFIKRVLRKTFKDDLKNLNFIIDGLERAFDIIHQLENNKLSRLAKDDPQSLIV